MGRLRLQRRLGVLVTLVFLGGVAAASAGSTVRAQTGVLKEYPFQVNVSWSIKDTFTTQCTGQRTDGSSLSGTVTATMNLVGHPYKPAEAIWFAGVSGRAAQGREPFSVRPGRELSSVNTSISIPATCSPLHTIPTTCAGSIKSYSSAVGELNPRTLLLNPPRNPTHAYKRTPPGAHEFCFDVQQVKPPTAYLQGLPTWWPAYPAVFDPNLPEVTASVPSGAFDCARRKLTTSFSDSYTNNDTTDYGYSATQQATATVTFTRILASQHRNAHLVGIAYPPQYLKDKPVYGC